MKRVTAFVGSARKRHTYQAVMQFMAKLEALGEVEYEIVPLSDFHIESCRGCKRCFDRGEELCPLKDDRDLLVGKIEASDGVVFATPNYSFQVSGLMKNFLDRLGYLFHRPRFFGKTFTSIVAQGIYGGEKIARYLDFVGNGLGFNTVRGGCLRTIDPVTEKAQGKIERTIEKQSRRFWRRLSGQAFPRPSLLKLMVFRLSRTSIRLMLDDRSPDFRYYRERGWFDSPYYYPTRIGLPNRAAGRLCDLFGARSAKPEVQAIDCV